MTDYLVDNSYKLFGEEFHVAGVSPNEHTNGSVIQKSYFGHLLKALIREMLGVI